MGVGLGEVGGGLEGVGGVSLGEGWGRRRIEFLWMFLA